MVTMAMRITHAAIKTIIRNKVKAIQHTPLNNRLNKVRYMANNSSGIVVKFSVQRGTIPHAKLLKFSELNKFSSLYFA